MSEGYPSNWKHATIHLNPATGEMHSDGDHDVRHWIQNQNAALRQQVADMKKDDDDNGTLLQMQQAENAELLTELNRVREVSAKQADERDELRAEVERLQSRPMQDSLADAYSQVERLQAHIAKMDAALALLSDYREVADMGRDSMRRIAREAREVVS